MKKPRHVHVKTNCEAVCMIIEQIITIDTLILILNYLLSQKVFFKRRRTNVFEDRYSKEKWSNLSFSKCQRLAKEKESKAEDDKEKEADSLNKLLSIVNIYLNWNDWLSTHRRFECIHLDIVSGLHLVNQL